MERSEYWYDRQSERLHTLDDWRQEWEEAAMNGELAENGWPSTWNAFKEKCLIQCDDLPCGGLRIRKRRHGGGRKRKGEDKLRICQISLSKSQIAAIKAAAARQGISQSAWVRLAVDQLAARECA